MSDNNQLSFYTITDLLELLPLGRNTIYRLVSSDDFPKIRIGRKIIIPAKKLEEWLEANIGTEIIMSSAVK
ncbi:helix-turn-helix transcriptional regulator [Paenibacillus sp. NPDC057934]|uniref:helix-turn-helix transcriptional regulator n=1 Tax=Paenibacillus sp. NPDC057934 TaxID=3346282 RepID=UPI0036D8CD4B